MFSLQLYFSSVQTERQSFTLQGSNTLDLFEPDPIYFLFDHSLVIVHCCGKSNETRQTFTLTSGIECLPENCGTRDV